MNDAQLLELISATDAYAPGTQLPASTGNRQDVLQGIERRIEMDTTRTTKTEDLTATGDAAPANRRSMRTLIGAAAFVLTIGVIGVFAVVVNTGDDGQEFGAGSAQETVDPFFAAQGFGAGSAQETADTFFAAYNDGDSDAVMALLSLDALIVVDTERTSNRADWEMEVVWDSAQGTVFLAPECHVSAEMAQAVVLACDTAVLNAPARETQANPVPTHLTMIVGPYGIRQLAFFHGTDALGAASGPFEQWMWNHRNDDATRVGFGRWESAEEARQNGILTAQYAVEWADFLEANGCTISDEC